MTETSTDRLSRLLSLLPWLAGRSTQEPVTITEAAERFGVSPERLEADLWLLICCGLPGYGPEHLIDIQFWDDDGHIDVIDAQSLSAPASLTFDEAIALQLGLQMLASVASEADRPLIEDTMALLSQATSGVVDTDRAVVADSAPSTVTTVVHEALRSSRSLVLEYFSATRDSTSTRTVHPRQLVFSDGHTYLEAWCASARAVRSFRLDRMLTATLGPPVEADRVESHDRNSGTGSDTGIDSLAPAPVTAIVRIATQARWLLDSYAFTVSADAPTEGEWIEATLPVWDRDWFIRLVLGQGGGLVCVEPSEWRTNIADIARRALTVTTPDHPH